MSTFTLKSTYASLPRTTRGQALVINGDPKGENFLYCNSSNVYIRNIENSSVSDVYHEHSKETTVAKYSPSRFYIASADKEGKVRVWDTVNQEHILKKEHHALSGAIKDLDWTMDSQKIIVVGEGRERFARAFTFDSGNSVGDMTGHVKSINAVAIKQSRPMRAATGSEDYTTVFYEGPPFKFKCTKPEHTNFVNCVRYSPDGSIFISGGSDGKLFMYDGSTSDFIAEIGEPKAHGGSIFAICFSQDGKKLLSASGDKTAKIWNIEERVVETEFVLGKQVNDMQLGCLWQGNNMITVSLSGYINYLDPENPNQPKKIIKGHNKPITSVVVTEDGSRMYSAGSDGLIISWDAKTSDCDDFKGKGHTNQVSDMVLDGDYLITVSMDDTIRFNSLQSLDYGINPSGTEVAVGSRTRLYIFSLNNGTLSEVKTLPAQEVMDVQYSPDGAYLVAARNKALMYNLAEWKDEIGNWGEQHTAKITCLKWSPDSRRFVTASLDSYLVLWELGKFVGEKPTVKAHPLSHVNKIGWLDNNTIVTAGQDSNLKIWAVSE
ncbi:actin-interacting protein 1 [Elysia marginata]|uniref:Actin-interacting protein 1 n=1 Tax=Elysia marginata TaxID=1093978 RepID=A0AAV4H6V0_9GAST|nr:actin-interacting protein 1 [Elysia marginata]